MKQWLDARRNRLFIFLSVACLAIAVMSGIFAVRRSRRNTAPSTQLTSSTPDVPLRVTRGLAEESATSLDTDIAALDAKAVYFRTTNLGNDYGKLTTAPLNALNQKRLADSIYCDRLHFAAGRGVCLTSDIGLFTRYYAVMFDEALRTGWTIPLSGIPSRVRLSPSGRLAGTTVFVSGHSYTSVDFSTQTWILDAASGKVLADLEQFSVLRDNTVFQSPDFNFWGVTFLKDENSFYATLASNGKTYLVKGDLAKRVATVIREGVECPAISPDNSRIGFKKRTGSNTWRIATLDLQTMEETLLGEARSVDDQIEWLDDNHILYSLSDSDTGSSAGTDIWSIEARPDAQPQLLIKGAYSPAIVSIR